MAGKSSWRACTPTTGAPSTKLLWGEHQLSSRPIQEEIRTVVSNDAFLRDLDRARFSDALLKAQRKLFLNEAVYTRITNDPALTAIVEQITQEENTIRYKVGDRELTRANSPTFWRTIRTESCVSRRGGPAARLLSQTASAFETPLSCATSLRENILRTFSPLLCCSVKVWRSRRCSSGLRTLRKRLSPNTNHC